MKTQRNILIAFLLNLSFAVFEFWGGIFTGSMAILSDAIHDLADAASIGLSYVLEKKSHKQPDTQYTYGYGRYSVLGGLITTLILLGGSVMVLYNAIIRIITPAEINYNGMILFAIVGVGVNFFAAFFTRNGDSLNQKAVNLHMLEDVLGWAVVLLGAIVMRFTNFSMLDPLMSIGVSVFILLNALKNLKSVVDLFLEKTPQGLDVTQIKEHLEHIEGVLEVHHIHLWSMDGEHHYATLHVVTDEDPHETKQKIRKELAEHSIGHATLEVETSAEHCHEKDCHTNISICSSHCLHHHSH